MIESVSLLIAAPEIFLACATLSLLLIGVFWPVEATDKVHLLALLALGVTCALVISSGNFNSYTTFGGMFIVDGFSVFMKVLVLLSSAISLFLSRAWMQREQLNQFEFPVLTLFATLGMLAIVSANSLMSMYLSLELQSLSLYIIVSYHRDSNKSTEAGLKYFVTGALASGLLLFGISFIYGFSGQTGFDELASFLLEERKNSITLGITIGMVFILVGLAFKIAAVPFHMWAPDVYEGAPTPVTTFLAVAPKVAGLSLLMRVVTGPFLAMTEEWQQIIVALAVASMILSAFAAINQSNIKRLMAYSSVGHIGYILIGLVVSNITGIRGMLVYLTIYLVMNLGTFSVILTMRQKGRLVENINDLSGLARTQPLVAGSLAALMFSMAGIPPLAGFFGKLYIFMAAIEAQLYFLAIIGALTSVVGAFYYLRIVKIMYFNEPVEPLDKSFSHSPTLVLITSSVFVISFFMYPSVLLMQAQVAASSLLFSG